MAKKKKKKKDKRYHEHWFVRSLKYVKPTVNKTHRQKKSLPGQIDLPGMEDKDEKESEEYR